jgi:hypothetical protein
MNDEDRRPVAPAQETGLFAGLPPTPHQHFTLYFYAALLRLLGQAILHFGSFETANERFPYLGGYFEEVARLGLEAASFREAHGRWRAGIDAWERAQSSRLPLAALRTAARLELDDITLLAQIGLPDEDPRLGLVFDALQGGAGDPRPTLGVLAAAWPHGESIDARDGVHRLEALGLVEPVPGEGGRVRPCLPVWDAVRGGRFLGTCGWARHAPADALPDLETLVLPAPLRADCAKVAAILEGGAARGVILRGPRHNGRGALAGALARRIGKGLLEVAALDGPRDPRWRTAAALACLLDAVIVTAAEPGPAESFPLPEIPGGMAPLFVTLGTSGGVSGALADRSITLRLPIPDAEARARLWRAALGTEAPGVSGLRLTSGNIVRAARVATAARAVGGDGHIDEAALRSAVRTLDRPGLEALARRVEPTSGWSQLAVSAQTLAEMTTLAARCRQRERLGAVVGPALDGLGPGVRALFKGPSGTGKTLAARLLAGALGMDLYRVDLSAVVNKYIGETEKNLERVFARAEELDVILLLDEGDALLTQRTGVQSANDRYANLETNYLLQRLESYEGVLLVTTNAGDRIDSAFQRRMDVVIDFALPDAAERWAIWQLHLPEHHEVDLALLQAAAQRCALSGAQIRNAALHASLLAVEDDRPLHSCHLEAAVEREYRKQGGLSPLRLRAGAR